jgi:hypothetical protein
MMYSLLVIIPSEIDKERFTKMTHFKTFVKCKTIRSVHRSTIWKGNTLENVVIDAIRLQVHMDTWRAEDVFSVIMQQTCTMKEMIIPTPPQSKELQISLPVPLETYLGNTLVQPESQA